MTIFLVLSFLALVIYGLERNHRRQAVPSTDLAGSSHIADRDNERAYAELHAAADHARPAHHGRPWFGAGLRARTL
ncbi:MAG: hypothetical protein ACRDT4_15545 [Micromonosporaceae bacterium]